MHPSNRHGHFTEPLQQLSCYSGLFFSWILLSYSPILNFFLLRHRCYSSHWMPVIFISILELQQSVALLSPLVVFLLSIYTFLMLFPQLLRFLKGNLLNRRYCWQRRIEHLNLEISEFTPRKSDMPHLSENEVKKTGSPC